MTRAHRNVNIAAVIVPFVAFIAAIPLLWNSVVGWSDLAIFAVIYPLTALSITIGFHRMLTHRAFETYRPIKYLLAVLGSMAVQGDVISWVSDHRKHHAFTDEGGRPAQPARGPRRRRSGGPARALPRARGLAVPAPLRCRGQALLARPARGSRHAQDQQELHPARAA